MFTTETFNQALKEGTVNRSLEWIESICDKNDIQCGWLNKTVNFSTGQRKTFCTLYYNEQVILEEKTIEETCKFLHLITHVRAYRGLTEHRISLCDVHDYHGSIVNKRHAELRYHMSSVNRTYGQYSYADTKKIIELLSLLKPEIEPYDLKTDIEEYNEL